MKILKLELKDVGCMKKTALVPRFWRPCHLHVLPDMLLIEALGQDHNSTLQLVAKGNQGRSPLVLLCHGTKNWIFQENWSILISTRGKDSFQKYVARVEHRWKWPQGPGILKCSQCTSSYSFSGDFLKCNPTLTESKFQKPGYCRMKSCDLEITSAILITNFYISEFPEHHRQPEQYRSSCSNPAACSG